MDCKDGGIYTISNFTWNHLKMIEGNGIFGDINKDAYDFVNEEISQFDMFFADEKNWPYEEDSGPYSIKENLPPLRLISSLVKKFVELNKLIIKVDNSSEYKNLFFG